EYLVPAVPSGLKAEPGAFMAFPGLVGCSSQRWFGWPVVLGLPAPTVGAAARARATAAPRMAIGLFTLGLPFGYARLLTRYGNRPRLVCFSSSCSDSATPILAPFSPAADQNSRRTITIVTDALSARESSARARRRSRSSPRSRRAPSPGAVPPQPRKGESAHATPVSPRSKSRQPRS